MGSLSSLNLASNNMRAAGAKHIVQAISQVYCSNGAHFEETTLLWGSKCKHCGNSKADHNNGALSVLSLKDNKLLTKEAGKALAQALAGNSTLKELDVSDNNWRQYDTAGDWMGDGPGFVQQLAIGLKDNRAISSLNLAQNNLWAEGTKVLAEALKANQIMTELNLSDNSATFDGEKHGEMSGIVALAEAIPDMGALTKLIMSENCLCTKEAGQALGNMLKANSVLKELDVSNNYDAVVANDGPGFAQRISEGLSGNGALIRHWSCAGGGAPAHLLGQRYRAR
jgi:hypothetical protein